MNERQRSILQEVADGKITPEDAVHLLDEAEEPAGGDPDGPAATRTGPRSSPRSRPPASSVSAWSGRSARRA